MKSDNQSTPPALPGSFPVLSVVAVLIGALALILTAYVIGGQYTAVTNESGDWFKITKDGLKSLGLASLLGVTGLALGIVVFTRGSARKSWGVTAIVLGSLPIVLGSILAGKAFFQQAVAVRRQVQRAQEFAQINQYVGKPIPAGPEVYTWKQEREVYVRCYERHFMAAYLAHGQRSPVWDQAAERFIRAWISRRVGDGDALDNRAFFELSRTVLAAGCKDPLVLYLASAAQLENGEKARLGQAAQAEADKSAYSSSVKWIIELWANSWSRQFRTPGYNFEESDQRALGYLRESLVNGDYQADEFVLLHYRLANNPGYSWLLRLNEEVCQMVENTPECPLWFTHLLRGEQEIRVAWKVRGGGYANTVSEKGWQGFDEHMRKAEEKLASSWKLNPQDPHAATEMIGVKMSIGDSPVAETRLWFDRAVAARMDHYPAYDKMLWALRPRWHGSHDAMLKFGEVCLETGRFDTRVPQYYVEAAGDVATERGDWSIYQEPQVYENIRKAFTGGAAQDVSVLKGRSFLTGNLMMAYRAGRYEDAGKDLAVLKEDPYADTLLTWVDNSEMVPGWIKAWNGPNQKLLLDLDKAREQRNHTRALELAKLLKTAVQGDSLLERWSQDLVAVLELEQELAAGNWVSIKPGKELFGWRPYAGDWKVNDDGSIQVAATVNGMMLKSLAQIGPNFVLRGEMEMLSSTTGDFQAGMVFGNLHPNIGDWYGFRILHGGDSEEVAVLSRTFASDLRRLPSPLKKSNTFEVMFSGGEVTASLNDQKLVDSLVLMRDKQKISPRMAFGLGAYSHQNEYVVRYRNLEIKRLKPTAPSAKQAVPK